MLGTSRNKVIRSASSAQMFEERSAFKYLRSPTSLGRRALGMSNTREPVLVVHGLRTVDDVQFHARVSALNKKLGDEWDLIPVFWGDLASPTLDLSKIFSTPKSGDEIWEERFNAALAYGFANLVKFFGSDQFARELAQDAEEADRRAKTKARYGMRYQAMLALNHLVGPYLLDVLQYQNPLIGANIRDRVRVKAKDYCQQGRAVSVIAHSLGGVVCFDLAIGRNTDLRLKRFVTLGSQPSLFCVSGLCDINERDGNGVYFLPDTIEKWTNIYHILDPLACITGKLFRLRDGTPPRDVELIGEVTQSDAHSCYWDSPESISAVRLALRE